MVQLSILAGGALSWPFRLSSRIQGITASSQTGADWSKPLAVRPHFQVGPGEKLCDFCLRGDASRATDERSRDDRSCKWTAVEPAEYAPGTGQGRTCSRFTESKTTAHDQATFILTFRLHRSCRTGSWVCFMLQELVANFILI